MKQIVKESDLFKSKSSSSKYDEILEDLNKTKKAKQELDRILAAMKLEKTFPPKVSKKVSASTHDLKAGDIIVKRGSNQLGEIVSIEDSGALIIRMAGKNTKIWRQEIRRVV